VGVNLLATRKFLQLRLVSIGWRLNAKEFSVNSVFIPFPDFINSSNQ
jgi:hypothetical protein